MTQNVEDRREGRGEGRRKGRVGLSGNVADEAFCLKCAHECLDACSGRDYETTQSSPNDFHINCTGAMPRLSQDSWANVRRASQRLGIFDKARLA